MLTMKHVRTIVIVLVAALAAAAPAPGAATDWKAVEQALGKSGQLMPGDVYRIGMPRTDLKVTAGHNHLNEMSPHVMYMHYAGHGDAVQLARGLRQALAAIVSTLRAPP